MDWKKRTTTIFTSKYMLVALILIPIFLAFFFRAYPATLPATDDWAQDSIKNSYVAQIEAQLRQEFPLLPQAQLRQRANALYEETYEQNKDALRTQEEELSKQFKSRLQFTVEKDDGSTYEQTYLLAIDPYYYMARSERFIETGDVCTDTKDGECWNNYMNAPRGSPAKLDWHTVVEGSFVKFFGMFGLHPITGAFFIPAIFAAFATIPAFFIIHRRWGSFAAALGALVVAVHTAFLGRTPAGFVDTDVWNVFFPLYIAWLVILALDRKDNFRYAYMAGAAVLTGIYSKFWTGWSFTFLLFIAMLVGTAVFWAARGLLSKWVRWIPSKERKEDLRRAATTGILLAVFLVVSSLIVIALEGPQQIVSAVMGPLHATTGLQDPVHATLWPNVFTTVAELNMVPLPSLIPQLGGRLLFVLATIGIFAFMLRTESLSRGLLMAAGIAIYYTILTSPDALRLNMFMWLALFALPMAAALLYAMMKKEPGTVHYGMLLMGWMAATMFATTQGTRFLLLLVPILGLAVGFAAGWIVRAAHEVGKTNSNDTAFYSRVAAILVLVLVVAGPVGADLISKAHRVGMSEVPSMNDAWWDSLTYIKSNSSEDAIVTSWWDFGHWFKYIADRPVTFDGGSQGSPRAHWVGNLLSNDDQKESVGMLRFLDCGADWYAYPLILEKSSGPIEAYRTTRQLIDVTQEDARAVLETEGFSKEEQDIVLQYTHCQPPEAYLIVSEDMVGKAGVWSHFGLWDFERAFVAQTVDALSRARATEAIADQLNVTQARAAQLYSEVQSLPDRSAVNAWVSPWPSYLGVRACRQTNGTLECAINVQVGSEQGVPLVAQTLTIDTETPESATISISAQNRIIGSLRPGKIVIDGVAHEIGGEFPFTVAIEDNVAVIGQDPLPESVFTQLFHREKPEKYFTLVSSRRDISGNKILVYKVNWDAYMEDLK